MIRISYLLFFVFGFLIFGSYALAATVTTPATGNISSDSVSGASVSVPNIVITEGAVNEIDKVAAHVWTVPSGYVFDTSAAAPNVAYTNGLAGPATASMTATTMTIDTTATSTSAGVITIGSTTPIKVKATTACPMAAAGNLTHTAGTITGVTNGTTNFGTWAQVPGAASKLVVQLPGQASLSATTCAVPTGTPSDQVIGSSFNVSVYAMDAAYNLGAPNNYTDGAKTLTYTPSGQSGTNVSATFSGGVANSVGVTVSNSGSYTLTFTDGASYGLASASFGVIGGSRPRDTISPASSITAPTDGEKIKAGMTYVIRGTSADEGTITVQQAEISFDGGVSWILVTPTAYTSNGFDWKYEWLNPKVGLYYIKIRGTDGFNIELPKSGVMITVEVPVQAVTPEVVSEEAPKTVAPEQQREGPAASEPKAQTEIPRPSVMLIRAQGDPRVYVIHQNLKRHIPSVAVFDSYGYAWNDVQVISPEAVSAYRTANLVRKGGDHKVYITENGKKKWIQTEEEFVRGGYNWNDVVEIDTMEFDFYSEEEAVRQVRIVTDVLNVRDLPSLDGKVVTQVTQKSVYPIVSETDSWTKIKLPGGTEGWVFAEYTESARR